MPEYGWCYDSTGNKCSGRAQPGARALRAVVDAHYVEIGDLGIYSCRPSSGGGGLSTHGEGRGWDAACNANDPQQKKVGDDLAALLVEKARLIGVQRVIWNRREWDSRERKWEAYTGDSAHRDHLHIELCWAAALHLTEDDVRSALFGVEEAESVTYVYTVNGVDYFSTDGVFRNKIESPRALADYRTMFKDGGVRSQEFHDSLKDAEV